MKLKHIVISLITFICISVIISAVSALTIMFNFNINFEQFITYMYGIHPVMSCFFNMTICGLGAVMLNVIYESNKNDKSISKTQNS